MFMKHGVLTRNRRNERLSLNGCRERERKKGGPCAFIENQKSKKQWARRDLAAKTMVA